jgi:hypothetical protein
MASSAEIAVSSNRYTGDAALGGGSLGVARLDVQPILDLAKYTMLYNRAEYDQRQKDAEFAAQQIADATSYDLTTSIPKDAKIIQDKYKTLTDFISSNPDAINYRNKEQWTKYQELKNDLQNDLKGAKVRSLLHQTRQKEIADTKDQATKDFLQKRLNEDIEKSDIRSPLPFTQQYDISTPEIPKPKTIEFDVVQKGPNENVTRTFELFDVGSARRQGNVFALDLDAKPVDMNTAEGQARALGRGNNFWIKGTEQLNAALQDPSLRDQNGVLDESKLSGLSKQLVTLMKDTNSYLESEKNKIASGVYKDNLGNTVSFGPGLLKEEDYTPINYSDGITPDELALAAQYAAWSGDKTKTTTQQTNDQIEQDRLAAQIRSDKASEAIQWANYGLNKEKLDKTNAEDLQGAESVINEAVQTISQGEANASGSKFKKRFGLTNSFDIADPALLQSFGKLDKDGNQYDVPDRVRFDKKKNQFELVYDKSKGRDEQKVVPLTERQYLSTIVKRKFPNKDIGEINNIVEGVLQKSGGLYDLSKKWPQGNASGNNSQNNTGAAVVVLPDGRRGQIPADQVDQFLKDNPGSKRE